MARAMAKHLNLPLLVKDDIKDAAFDTLGWSDREWSRQIGGLSFAVMYRLLRAQLENGQSVVVETAFNPKVDALRFDEIKAQFPFSPIQVVVTTDGDTLFSRFIKRAESGDRHPGHVDIDEDRKTYLRRLSESPYTALPIDGPVIEVDSSDFGTIETVKIAEQVQAFMANQ